MSCNTVIITRDLCIGHLPFAKRFLANLLVDQ
jgi:hypothetical protein